jgi:ATP-binding cassette subfamily B multidrug efflux pump
VNQAYLDRNRALIRLQGVFYPSMTFFLGLSALVVLWLGSREVILGRMTLGEFVAFNSYLGMLSWPMIAFGWVTNLLQRGTASWKRLLDILDTPPAIQDAPDAKPASEWGPLRGDIEFRDLTFAYAPDAPPVLEHVSLSIAAGQTVAIIGATGSGKSTLISLLPRLHDPPPGTVFVDGVDVRDIPLRVLRGAIGMVPQEPFLFSETVAENIAFGAPLARAGLASGPGAAAEPPNVGAEGLDAVLAAAEIARLDKDVDAFPKAWETMVGERGLTLSGGQKQRTALARALLIDPPILILDDALSAVDTYTEEEILSRLRRVMRQRTSIIVAHRVSTVRDADLIVVLDRGRVVERGTHDELVRANGIYAEMNRKQLLEEELAAS